MSKPTGEIIEENNDLKESLTRSEEDKGEEETPDNLDSNTEEKEDSDDAFHCHFSVNILFISSGAGTFPEAFTSPSITRAGVIITP